MDVWEVWDQNKKEAGIKLTVEKWSRIYGWKSVAPSRGRWEKVPLQNFTESIYVFRKNYNLTKKMILDYPIFSNNEISSSNSSSWEKGV